MADFTFTTRPMDVAERQVWSHLLRVGAKQEPAEHFWDYAPKLACWRLTDPSQRHALFAMPYQDFCALYASDFARSLDQADSLYALGRQLPELEGVDL